MAAAAVKRLQDPYMATLDISTYEHIKLYNKVIFGLPESYRYDLTRSKWNYFYQELEYDVSKFWFKAAFLIVEARDAHNAPTEVMDILLSYPYITQFMVDLHCEILWADNSGSYLGRCSAENYRAGIYEPEKHVVISQQQVSYTMLVQCIKNSLTTYDKRKLRSFRSAYTFNTQDDGDSMFFVVVKMLPPDTRAGFSDINSKL